MRRRHIVALLVSVSVLSEWLTMVSAGAFYFAINQTHVIQTGRTAAMIYFPHPDQVRLEIFVTSTSGIGTVVGLFVTSTSLWALIVGTRSRTDGPPTDPPELGDHPPKPNGTGERAVWDLVL